MDGKKADELLNNMQENGGQLFDSQSQFLDPLLELAGNDENGLLKYLEGLKLEDLDWVSGYFYRFYEKWHDQKTKRRLDKLVKKLEKGGYSFGGW